MRATRTQTRARVGTSLWFKCKLKILGAGLLVNKARGGGGREGKHIIILDKKCKTSYY